MKARHGTVNEDTAPNKAKVELTTGASAVTQMVAELNGKYGMELNDRPTLVISFNSEDAAEEVKAKLEDAELPTKFKPEWIEENEEDRIRLIKEYAQKKDEMNPEIK